MLVVKEVYRESKKFPTDERFGLISQIRRSAVSVPSNIAEGHGRKSTKAYINHLSIAFGSLMEVETLLKISTELNYLSKEKSKVFLKQTQEIGKMLSGLMTSLQNKLGENKS